MSIRVDYTAADAHLCHVLPSTGYANMREVNAALFGQDVIDKTDEVYGLDEEGELRGSYRPSGYPGVNAFSRGLPIVRC